MRPVPAPDLQQEVSHIERLMARVRSGEDSVQCTLQDIIDINNLLSGDARIGDSTARTYKKEKTTSPCTLHYISGEACNWDLGRDLGREP